MIRILTISDWYLPAYKAGGPILSLSNMITTLGSGEFEFHVLTGDRDLGDRAPYADRPIDSWTPLGKTQVLYTRDSSFKNLRRCIAEVRPDVLHLNSFFSRRTIKILLLRKLGLLDKTPIVLSPRGEFTPGAFGLKKTKKRLFLTLAGLTGLYKNLFWQVSTSREKQDTETIFSTYGIGKGAKIGVASPVQVAALLEAILSDGAERGASRKKPGQASFVFVSRVSPKKNLETAIRLVSSLKGDVTFDIYGPVDDPAYWRECKADIARAPKNVTTRYLGPLPRAEACKKFLQYHFFLFPTLGENFGHAIIEAWGAGCPVIISDQTPWLHLESKKVGWDLPLDDGERWRDVLQSCVDMDAAAYQDMSQRSIKFLQDWAHSQNPEDIGAIFLDALAHDSSIKANGKPAEAAGVFGAWKAALSGTPARSIILDCLGVRIGEQRGAERFICGIIAELASMSNRDCLLLVNKSSLEFVKGLLPRSQYVLLPISGKNRIWRMVMQMIVGPVIARRFSAALYVSTSVFPTVGFPCPTAAVVHDLLLYHFPRTYSRPVRLFRAALLKVSLPTLSAVFTVSRASADDIRARFPRAARSIHIVPNGAHARIAAPVSAEREHAILEELSLKNRRFVLSVLGAGMYKNPHGLAAAAQKLIDCGHDDIDVVVAGDAARMLRTMAPARSLRPLGFVSDEVLSVLYSNAKALVFPTFFEGFGIPVIEAQAAGLPVICSDIPVLREAAGKSAVFVDPHRSESIAEAIIRVVDSPELQKQLIDAGKENAARFTWRRAAEEFLRASRAVMEEGPIEESLPTSV